MPAFNSNSDDQQNQNSQAQTQFAEDDVISLSPSDKTTSKFTDSDQTVEADGGPQADEFEEIAEQLEKKISQSQESDDSAASSSASKGKPVEVSVADENQSDKAEASQSRTGGGDEKKQQLQEKRSEKNEASEVAANQAEQAITLDDKGNIASDSGQLDTSTSGQIAAGNNPAGKPAVQQNSDSAPQTQAQQQVAESDAAQAQPAKQQTAQDATQQPVGTKRQTGSRPSSAALANQDLANLPELLKILVNKGVLDVEKAQEVNNFHLSSDRSIEDILKNQDIVRERALYEALAEYNDIPFVNVNDTGISPEALNLVDESVAKRYQMLPFGIDKEREELLVAMANPLNLTATNFVKQKTGYGLQLHYAAPTELKRVLAQRYAQDLSSDVTEAVEESSIVKRQEDIDAGRQKKGGMIRAAPINKIVNTILDYAMDSRASDVHIEPQPNRTRVRYRIDGVLQEKLVLPSSVHNAVVSRIKILADLKIDERRVPQDGRFDYSGKNQEVDLRVSTCPSIHGEKVVMRLLKKNASVPGLRGLGMRGLALKTLQKAIRIPNGIILITGPTGSGKTTSLYSILNIINTPKVNIMTLEDPVEYQMKGVTQVQVNPQAGLKFANGLRSFLRQDPDIIMVGEIRDTETAELAVQASLTGHLVFSTLHTNSAAGALPRLMDMGIEPFLLSSSVILTMAQRVVRRINPEFKEEYHPDQAVIDDIKNVLGQHFKTWCQQNEKDPEHITLSRAKKDRPDTEPEYKGRIGIFEVLDITDKIQHMINQKANTDELEKEAIKNGMMLMKQDGYIKALEGITTVEEVLRVAEVK